MEDSLELFRGTKILEKKESQPPEADDEEELILTTRNDGDEHSPPVEDENGEENVLALLKSLRGALLESSEAVIDGVDLEPPTGGMSLLALKNLLMTDYLKNMLILVKNKLKPYASKKTLEDSESTEKATERLVELRIILERIRPVESKLKTLIDRLVHQASQEKNFQFSGVSKTEESRMLRPRPEDMVLDDDDEEEGKAGERNDGGGDEEEEEEGAGEGTSKVKKYKPPQLSAAYYDPGWEESATGVSRRGKTRTSLEQRLMVREMMANADGDEPEEITNEEEGMGFLTAAEKRRHQAEERHRLRFEEDNFIRLPLEKGKRRLPTVGTADKVLLYGRDGADDDDLRIFGTNDGSEMPAVGYAAPSKRLKKQKKKLTRKQKKNKGRAKAGKRAKRARRK